MPETTLSPDVLLVEDHPGDARMVEHHLNAPHVEDIAGDVTLQHAESLTAGLEELERGSYDILFLDLGLPESSGLATLERALEGTSQLPIVVLTGLDDRETAVTAIQRGAQDYLPKDDIDADKLARSLRYAVERYRQEAQLRRKNERLDKFASVVSHDLRNPLNVAKGRLDMARSQTDSADLEEVERALERMEALIDDLLTLARQGDAVEGRERAALGSIVRESWRSIDTGEAELVLDGDGTVYADTSRLAQLLENLFRNAIEHNDEPVTITVGVADGTLYVEDDGRGIPPEARDRVFESGYSTSSTGTGFGLMIVEEIVNAHGWAVDITEGADGGARFEIAGVDAPAADSPAVDAAEADAPDADST